MIALVDVVVVVSMAAAVALTVAVVVVIIIYFPCFFLRLVEFSLDSFQF